MGIRLERAILRHLRMPLVHFFETSFSRTYERDILIVEVVSDGISGWGEVTAGEHPFYNEEWTDSAWLLLKNYIGPRVLGKSLETAPRGDFPWFRRAPSSSATLVRSDFGVKGFCRKLAPAATFAATNSES